MYVWYISICSHPHHVSKKCFFFQTNIYLMCFQNTYMSQFFLNRHETLTFWNRKLTYLLQFLKHNKKTRFKESTNTVILYTKLRHAEMKKLGEKGRRSPWANSTVYTNWLFDENKKTYLYKTLILCLFCLNPPKFFRKKY